MNAAQTVDYLTLLMETERVIEYGSPPKLGYVLSVEPCFGLDENLNKTNDKIESYLIECGRGRLGVRQNKTYLFFADEEDVDLTWMRESSHPMPKYSGVEWLKGDCYE